MRRLLTSALTLAMVLALAPLAAADDGEEVDDTEGTDDPVACDVAPHVEQLTPEGFELTVDAPPSLPTLAATRDATEDARPLHSVPFHFAPDVQPFERARVTASISWEAPGDYEIWIIDSEIGFPLASAFGEDLEGASASATVDHCRELEIQIRGFAGPPGQDIDLEVTVDNLAGGDDPDAEPTPADDTRSFLYAGGDPGQGSMTSQEYGTPLEPTLDDERPTDAQPNTYVRPVVGFNDRANPFLPHFFTHLDEPIELDGRAGAVVWVSSSTLSSGENGTLVVDLYLDMSLAGSVEIDGSEIGEAPTPVLVDFGEIEQTASFEVLLQVGTVPAVSTQDQGEPEDANHTVYYDSAQFPTQLILPTR